MTAFAGFSKDILLIDFEGTGFPQTSPLEPFSYLGDPTQVGAILLDKNDLSEKNSFITDIRADPDKLQPWVLEHTDITAERVAVAPTRKAVAKQLKDTFGTDFYIASWNIVFDRLCLELLMLEIGQHDSIYDYHHIDIWSLSYAYLCQLGHPEIIRSEDAFRAFGQDARAAHNALDDCRRTAEVLRATVNQTELSL